MHRRRGRHRLHPRRRLHRVRLRRSRDQARSVAREDPRGRTASHRAAARRAVPHQLRHRDRSRHPADPRHRRRRCDGWGECVAQAEPTYSAEYVDAAALVIEAHLLPRLVAAGDVTAAEVAGLLAAGQGPPDGEGGARDGGARRRAARRAARACTPTSAATRDRIPSGVSVGIFDTIDRLLSEVAGLRRRRVRPHQAQDRAGLGHRAGASRARADRARHAAPGRCQHGVLAGRHRAPVPARRVRPAAHRATPRRGGHRRSRRAGQGVGDPGVPRRVDRVGPHGRRRDRARRGRDHQHQARVASAATSRPVGSTTCASIAASRCGAAAWSRPASGAPPTPPSPPCPDSRCRATSAPRRASTPATSSPSRSPWSMATSRSRPAPVSASSSTSTSSTPSPPPLARSAPAVLSASDRVWRV